MMARWACAWLIGCSPTLSWFIAPAAAQEGSDPQRPEELNIEIVLDVSGSMVQVIETGETRMEAAKRVLRSVVESIPEQEGVNVGFRVFGQEGDNTEAGREVSCNSSQLLVEIDGVRKGELLDAIDETQPVGWTPIALALESSAEDFPEDAGNATNAVVLVTDGTETCGGDPCAVASDLHQQEDLELVTHVVSFALTPEDQERLSCIAENGGGLLLGAGDDDELREALFSVLQELGRGPVAGPTIGLTGIPGTEEAASRAFVADEEGEGTLFMSFAVVRFEDEETAQAATRAIRARVIEQFRRRSDVSGLKSVDAGSWGDETLALAGPIEPTDPDDPEVLAIALLVVRDGLYVHGMLGVAASGDPLPDVSAVAEQVVGREPGESSVATNDEGLLTGGLWDMLPRPADLPTDFVLDEEFVPQL
ncbi:MAG: VWA domain-containing protein [Chloroflexota bacterium]|nr:VWA domain-containing protein [Chloroflexota bacterium]